MTRTRSTLLAAASRYVAMAVSAAAGFAVVPIILRYIDKADYGLWIAMGEVLGYLAVLDFGTGAAVTRMSARLRGSTRELGGVVSTALAVNVAFAGLFILAGCAVAWVLPGWSAVPAARIPTARALLLIMVARGAVSFPIRVAANTLTGLQLQVYVNLLNAAGTVLSPAVYLVLLQRGLGVVALPIGLFAGTVVTSLPTFFLLKRAVRGLRIAWSNVTRGEAKSLFTWSTLFFLNNIAVIVIYYTDNVVVASRVGLAAVSRFALTSSLILYWHPFLVAVSDSAIPACIELFRLGEHDRMRTAFLHIMRLTLGAAVCVAVTAAAINPAFVAVWVGKAVYGGDALTFVFALILVHRTLMQVSSVVVISTGRIRGVALMSLVEAALNLALSLWLARPLGILGVALGTAIAALATSGWYVPWIVIQELRMDAWRYVYECWAQPLLAGLAAATAAVLLRLFFMPATWPQLVLAAATIGLAFAAVFLSIEWQRGTWPFHKVRLWRLCRS